MFTPKTVIRENHGKPASYLDYYENMLRKSQKYKWFLESLGQFLPVMHYASFEQTDRFFFFIHYCFPLFNQEFADGITQFNKEGKQVYIRVFLHTHRGVYRKHTIRENEIVLLMNIDLFCEQQSTAHYARMVKGELVFHPNVDCNNLLVNPIND